MINRVLRLLAALVSAALAGPVLAGGFIGLGGPTFFGDGSYAITVTLPDGGTVPEPGGVVLVLTAAVAAAWSLRRRPHPTQPTPGGRR